MTYVIAEPCIGEKNGACVDVCPAGCIHTTPEAPQNYIDPDVCIECEQCVLVCPVDAVFLDKELPEEWRPFVNVNAQFFRSNKSVADLDDDISARMIDAIRTYATRSGLSVGAVILNRAGVTVSSHGEGDQLAEAARKAYTALMFGVATHELRQTSLPLWHDASEIDEERIARAPGGFPVIEGVDTLGAVGVAGAGGEHDVLCCQAALEVRWVH